jgi:hypothetical protein
MIVAIDGPGGAAKTTLATSIAALLDPSLVVPTDNFRRPPADQNRRFLADGDPCWNTTLSRLRDQILEPASRGLAARWQCSDWQSDLCR